jgi:hypothetical protein
VGPLSASRTDSQGELLVTERASTRAASNNTATVLIHEGPGLSCSVRIEGRRKTHVDKGPVSMKTAADAETSSVLTQNGGVVGNTDRLAQSD